MLVNSAKPSAGRALRTALHSPTRSAQSTSSSSRELYPLQAHSYASSSRARTFWTSDDPLLKALRRRQESYRLRQVGDGARKKADRLEAVQLARSEIRWIVQHVRRLQGEIDEAPSASKSKSRLSRDSRRHLVSMAVQMTRNNVPISYLLGSVPFGDLPQELNVRPPILLPRPETENWAAEVVKSLLNELDEAHLDRDIRIVDLCTGSGCIALLIADALRTRLGAHGRWKVVACDRSPLAVDLARENAVKLEFNLTDQGTNVHIVQADIFSNQDVDQLASLAGGPFDLILSNPPYIPRREWNNLSAEVKAHEDPAALIGERDILSAHSSTQQTAAEASLHSDSRQNYLDRHGLAFHQRLAELLYRPTFSASIPRLPRLVAEYGKGQQKPVERLHVEMKAPKDRLPKIVRVEGHRLVVVGVGNATTHPLTRHSIGQIVLDPLLQRLVEQDKRVRLRLKHIRDQLEQNRVDAVETGWVDTNQRRDWKQSVPASILIRTTHQADITPQADATPALIDVDNVQTEMPSELTKTKQGSSGGWSADLTLLVPASPTFFSSHTDATEETIYLVDVSLYKPSHAMNLSGVGLRSFLHSHHPLFALHKDGNKTAAEGWRIENDVLVMQDELDLDFGDVKRRDTGSARGHNGIRDIISRLAIPDSPPASSQKGKKNQEGSGPNLTRLRIGIGRPDVASKPDRNSGKDSWLPVALKPKSKPVPIDRWVLSPLSQEQLDSCRGMQDDSVLQKVQAETLQWIQNRCHALSTESTHDADDVQTGAGRITSRKDQFGVSRTVWVY